MNILTKQFNTLGNETSNKACYRLAHKQRGVTLIESVIALLVFSLGALGLTAMQLTSLGASGSSQQRSVVLWKAQEFIDRIKSNDSIVDQYVAAIGNQTLVNLGVDGNAGLLNCDDFPQPANFCADSAAANAGSCNAAADKVNYDVWDVFCNPQSGLASSGAASANTIGVIGLEVAFRQNTVAANGNDDHLLAFEWVSRETENNANIANADSFAASLCGEPQQNIASNLDVYCIRFRP